MRFLINHLGYEPEAPKFAVLQAEPSEIRGDNHPGPVRVVDTETGELLAIPIPEYVGPVPGWGDAHYWVLDFSAVTATATCRLECEQPGACPVRSEPFVLRRGILSLGPLSDVCFYFKAQRVSGADEIADSRLPFAGKRPGRVDLRGGWYDATGDYGVHLSHLSYSIYFNPQQVPLTVWSILRVWEQLEGSSSPEFTQLKKRLLEEGLYGADFLVRMRAPGGSFYRSKTAPGPEKRPEDRQIGLEGGVFLIKEVGDKRGNADEVLETDIPPERYETGFRMGAGLAIAALALAARSGVDGGFPRAEYRKAAESAFLHLREENERYLRDGKENILDTYCALLAAVELTRLNTEYQGVADQYALNLLGRLSPAGYWVADGGDRPFFHASDAGLPALSLALYLGTEPPQKLREKVLEALERSFSYELGITAEGSNPFSYARQYVQSVDGRRRRSFFMPHDCETSPWWQGENARICSLAAAARAVAALPGLDSGLKARLTIYATRQLDWVLGLNPFDACMLHGSGRNNPPYTFFGSRQYLNCPGGIVNGITSGIDDEEGIALNPQWIDGKMDNSWRWGEQWLPHASWFLYATARGLS